MFLNSLSDRGYNLTIKTADDSSLNLKYLGEYIYSHLILLSPSVKEFGGLVNVKEIVRFLDGGGNLFVAADSTIGEAIRELGSECGVEFDEENTYVNDHFNYNFGDSTHVKLVVPVDNIIKSPVIVGKNPSASLLYRGIGISADPLNPLLIDILHASETAYSYNPKKKLSDYPNTVGTNTQLITALQARNNARAIFIGSIDFLSNEYFEAKVQNALKLEKPSANGNQYLVNNLMRWVLGERGQLRYSSPTHHRVGESVAPSQYTIMDEVVYSIKIETKTDEGQWVPYISDDIQLEFVRIDPFIRKTLAYKDGLYQLVMKLPDVYGVFKFVVDYHRLGYTHLQSVMQMPVRPFTHTQYERFIFSAYPYYTSALSMMIGVTLFSIVFLYLKDEKEKCE